METVAQLVDQLFRTHRRRDGREYTYQEVSEALNGELNPTYISKLRKGKIANPGRTTLLQLCIFFQVSPTYFFPELNQRNITEELLTNPNASLSPATLRLALRSAGLGAEAQEYVEKLIDILQRAQSDRP